jgi:hypothetical protein
MVDEHADPTVGELREGVILRHILERLGESNALVGPGDDAACAEVSVRLPDTVDGQSRIWTDAQATGAWGNDGSAILLRCGVTPPGPTEAKCITLGGVDWIVDETQAPKYLVTTYGREPAVEVFIDNETVSPNEVLTQLGERVVQNATTSDSACTNTETLLDDATAG